MGSEMQSCFNCGNLDRSRTKVSSNGIALMYGCSARKTGYVNGWCNKSKPDAHLKLQGCSDWTGGNQQMNLFEVMML